MLSSALFLAFSSLPTTLSSALPSASAPAVTEARTGLAVRSVAPRDAGGSTATTEPADVDVPPAASDSNGSRGASRELDDAPLLGHRIPDDALGAGVIETVEAMLARSRAASLAGRSRGLRGDARGEWFVEALGGDEVPRDGDRVLVNHWGDTRMAIGFPSLVDVEGLLVAGFGSPQAWAKGLRVIGSRGDEVVGEVVLAHPLEAEVAWFALDLAAVDRLELIAEPAFGDVGWYALDELRYRPAAETRGAPALAPDEPRRESVPPTRAAEDRARIADVSSRAAKQRPPAIRVGFDDLAPRTALTGTGYAGLRWPFGTGFDEARDDEPRAIPPPLVPPAHEEEPSPPASPGAGLPTGSAPGTAPTVLNEFVGMRMFENGTSAIPADTCGAVGPDHFVSVVNVKLGVFDKSTGARVHELPLADFFQTTALGDPRVTYDHFSGRWFVLCSSGPSTARLYLAISLTGDPAGAWFKTYIDTAIGADAGRWPDYPTLGFDERGFYTSALMVPSTVTIFAIDKAPLLANPPSLGAVTAFRDLPFEGATQPCVTHGDSGGELFVGRRSPTRLKVRQLTGPMSAPVLSTVANIDVPSHANPPDAPALGSLVDLDSGDTRPINAVWRAGSIWTAQGVAESGRAAVRWYELDVASAAVRQAGTISDPVWSYTHPSLAVNADGHVVLAFSGSHEGAYASAFFTGRHALDPLGVMAAPALLRAGAGPYNHTDGNGNARWGDYSLTSIDPLDDRTFWTIQKYGRVNNRWGTWIAELAITQSCPAPWAECVTSPNSVGAGASMSSGGTTSVAANDFELIAHEAPAGQPGIFFYGPSEFFSLFGNGLLCVGGGVQRLPTVTTDASGTARWPLDLTNPPSIGGQISAGSTWYFQFWYRDPAGGGAAFNLSDSLAAIFCR